ncbi:MAG: hypothetical protein VZR54_01725 [Ruminococcus sp.]|jgi:anti-sigma B factor antagonist|nr:hypothetical protein [Ruminococcus sp.]
MKVNKSKNGNTLQVSVEGRVDTATAPRFDAEVKSALSGITELVIDFSELEIL